MRPKWGRWGKWEEVLSVVNEKARRREETGKKAVVVKWQDDDLFTNIIGWLIIIEDLIVNILNVEGRI